MNFYISSRPAAAGMIFGLALYFYVMINVGAREISHTTVTEMTNVRVNYGPLTTETSSNASVALPVFENPMSPSSVVTPSVGTPEPDVADHEESRKAEFPRSDSIAMTKPSGRRPPVLLGQILSNVLNTLPWSGAQTNSKCSDDMKTYGEHVLNGTVWAAKMLDATSKGPEGLLNGNTFGFGNFDQCMKTKSKHFDISGGYTLVDIDYRPTYESHPEFYDDDHSDVNKPLDDDDSAWTAINHNIEDDFVRRHQFQWAVCLPDTCRHEDVQKIISNVLLPEMNRFGMEANVTIDPWLHTSRKNTYQFTTGFYIVCAIFMGITGLVIVGTLYDTISLYYRPKSEHGLLKLIVEPFSLNTNLERLLKPSNIKEFSIINGLKCIFILQNITAHRWLVEFGLPQMNPDFTHQFLHSKLNGYFKCYVHLETFFVISGFLTFNLLTKHLNERKRLKLIPILISRYLRIIPVYATLILTYIFILPYLNDGPYWRKLIYKEVEVCRSNWWTNVLFINNYVHTDEVCLITTWYLACDMHFFIVGALITYAIWKWRNIGLTILGACLTLSTIVPAYIILKEQHRGLFKVDPETFVDLSKDRFFTDVYSKSHMRSMTYFIGISTGYLYMRMKESNYKLSSQSLKFLAPILIIVINLIYLSGGWFSIGEKNYVAHEHTLYFTLNRIVWSMIIGHALIAHGLSGLGVCISGLLSHRVFHVLGKLVFCIYMFQELIQLQTSGSIRSPTYNGTYLANWKFFSDTSMALIYAFVVCVMVESPFDILQKKAMKMFLEKKFSKPESEHDTINLKITNNIKSS